MPLILIFERQMQADIFQASLVYRVRLVSPPLPWGVGGRNNKKHKTFYLREFKFFSLFQVPN